MKTHKYLKIVRHVLFDGIPRASVDEGVFTQFAGYPEGLEGEVDVLVVPG